jgi:ABC-type phosphate transport system auxiliary subunit
LNSLVYLLVFVDKYQKGKELIPKTDESSKRKADIRFEPILAALAENPKWFHTMKHAVELSADLQKLTGLQLEGPEGECLQLLSDVAEQVQDDEALRKWMEQLGSYIDDAYNNTILSQSADFQQRGQQIAESLHALKKRLKKNTDVVKLFSQVRSVVNSLSEDNAMTRFYTASSVRL